MHQPILGAGAAAAGALGLALPLAFPLAFSLGMAGPAAAADSPAAAGSAAPADRPAKADGCPAPQAAVAEHFIAADCPLCWSAADDASAAAARPANPAAAWRFDWIVPGRDDAPMALAALRDSQDRLQRLGQPAPAAASQWRRMQVAGPAAGNPPEPGTGTGTGTGTASSAITPTSQPSVDLRAQRDPATDTAGRMLLAAQAGPAWLGNYMALQFTLLADSLPAGSSGWLAMVELLPAGSEGSAQPRALMRNVAGPLPLDSWQPGQPLSHLRAMRWPDGTDATRLQARAWIEAPDGRLLAVVADRCPAR